MSQTITCENFLERLEALTSVQWPGEELVLLEQHADRCPDCAMLLRMHRHLSGETLADLEARVPAALVDGMWPRISAGIAAIEDGVEIAEVAETPGSTGHPLSAETAQAAGAQARWRRRLDAFFASRPGRAGRWLVPALAAGLMVLLFASGYLLGEVHQLKQRERMLAESLLYQQQLAASWPYAGTPWPSSGPGWPAAGTRQPWYGKMQPQLGTLPSQGTTMPVPPGSTWLSRVSPHQGRESVSQWNRDGWLQHLASKEALSVGELKSLLAQMPAQAIVLEAGDLEAGPWQRPYRHELVRLATGKGVRTDDGLAAAEAVQILETLNLDPERTIVTTRLLVMAAGKPPGEFSRAGRRVRPLRED